MPKIDRWLTIYDLMDRWERNPDEIEHFIKELGLPVYDKPYSERFPPQKVRNGHLSDSRGGYGSGTIEWSYRDSLHGSSKIHFRLSDVEEFERKHPELLEEAKPLDPPTALSQSSKPNETQSTAKIKTQQEEEFVFARSGKIWIVRYEGKEIQLPDHEKYHYIGHLLDNPGREINNTDLVSLVKKTTLRPKGHDEFKKRAKSEKQEDRDLSISDLREELSPEEEASLKKIARQILEEYDEDSPQWAQFHNALLDRGIRIRVKGYEIYFEVDHDAGTEADRSKNKAKAHISLAIKDLRDPNKGDPNLATHLRRFITTHDTYSIYNPEESVPWHVVV